MTTPLAGALGALARYGLDGFVARRTPGGAFPWGTFTINISGSFALGLLSRSSRSVCRWTRGFAEA